MRRALLRPPPMASWVVGSALISIPPGGVPPRALRPAPLSSSGAHRGHGLPRPWASAFVTGFRRREHSASLSSSAAAAAAAAAASPSKPRAQQAADDARYMALAVGEAVKAADAREVPVGAVLVHTATGEVLASHHNTVLAEEDPTAHAEMKCIREGAQRLGSWRALAASTLYVTLEPCPMCAGAVLNARLGAVVWGAPNLLIGADGSWISLMGDGGGGSEDGHRVQTGHGTGNGERDGDGNGYGDGNGHGDGNASDSGGGGKLSQRQRRRQQRLRTSGGGGGGSTPTDVEGEGRESEGEGEGEGEGELPTTSSDATAGTVTAETAAAFDAGTAVASGASAAAAAADGAATPRLYAAGSGPLRPHAFKPRLEVRRRVLKHECADLMRGFFRQQRALSKAAKQAEKAAAAAAAADAATATGEAAK